MSSSRTRRRRRCARNGQCSHLTRSGLQQHGGARIQRRAGRTHIVDEDHDSVREPGLARLPSSERRQRERAADVPPSCGSVKSGLRRCGARAPERAFHWQTDLQGKRFCLIESAAQSTPRMERHGHDAVRVGKQVGARAAQHCAKRTRQAATAVVLERVKDVAQRPFVIAGRACRAEKVATAAAARALLERRADDAPRWQRVAARAAERRNQRYDTVPTSGTDRTIEWRGEDFCARSAVRSERNREKRV